MEQEAGKLIEKLENGAKLFYQEGYGLSEDVINKIHEKLMKMNVPFIEHGRLLYVLKGKNSKGWETTILKKLKHGADIRVLRFYRLNEDTILKSNTFEFSEKTSVAIVKYLPNLEEISVNNMAVSNFVLTNINSVTKVTLEFPFFKDARLSLKLPNLKTFELWNTVIKDPKTLEDSFINCPRIENFFCRNPNYEGFLGNSGNPDYMPTFYLPHCLLFSLLVSETLKSLWMYAPRLKKLDLSNSHIDEFKFIENGKAEMKEYNLPKGTSESKFQLKMSNGNFSENVTTYLKRNPRNVEHSSEPWNKPYSDTNNNINPPKKKRARG